MGWIRWRGVLLALLAGVGIAVFVAPAQPAQAECSWRTPWDCLPGRTNDQGTSNFDCRDAPAASRPDSGLAGWFAREPKKPPSGDPFAADATVSTYDVYGYAGLDYSTYDLGCGPDAVREPAAVTTTTIANLIYAPALWLVALDNSVREYAYSPGKMWGWTDGLVQRASDALRDRIFTPWGGLVLAVVGIWLLWGARGGNMSAAVTTAGWALLVMAFVSAVAMWPLKAATMADSTLTGALGQVNGVLAGDNPNDKRDPAVRASGVLTRTVLYQQWLRGTLGSSESDVARKYGPDLYKARAISWAESQEMAKDTKKRDEIFDEKAKLWNETAEKIKNEDPEAYEYLVGRKGTERIGAAMLAFISALVVTPFDLMASLLVLIAFLIVRLAVIFLPAIGTVGIFLPASGPLRGVLRTVAAAMINCVIFGAGSAVFLLATEIITGTGALAGWQQILLVWLVGLILWLLLRPYRRLTQLTGADPFQSIAGGLGRMQQRVFGGMKQLAVESAGTYAGLEAHDRRRGKAGAAAGGRFRPETWSRIQTLTTSRRALTAGPAGATASSTAATSAMGRAPERGGSVASVLGKPGVAAPQPQPQPAPSGEYRQPGAPADRSERAGSVHRPRVPADAAIVPAAEQPVYRPDRPESRTVRGSGL